MAVIEEQGYIIVASDTVDVDYVYCAQRLAESLKSWHPNASICLLTNRDDKVSSVFDHVKQFPYPINDNAYANDWQVFHATPYRETIKLEADMLITSEIDHWWTLFRHRDLVISTGCRDWQDTVSTSTHYRRVFSANGLPDVYNAITYWRLSSVAQEFFSLVRLIFENYASYKTLLKYPEDIASTDVVYALAARILGEDRVTMPFASYPRIVHMKQHHAGTESETWNDELIWEYDKKRLKINGVVQHGTFHYQNKEWIHGL